VNMGDLDNLEKYVKSAKRRGADDSQIKQKLLKAGFDKNIVEKAFSPIVEPVKKTGSRIHTMKPVYIISAIVILVFIILMFVFNSISCDEICFIEKVNNCEPTVFTKSIDNITIMLESYDDCSLTKTIIALDETEPIEIEELFLDKSMTCTYEQGLFSEDLVKTLSGGIDYCEGELKDNILIVLSLIE